jgi:hypothetical protein
MIGMQEVGRVGRSSNSIFYARHLPALGILGGHNLTSSTEKTNNKVFHGVTHELIEERDILVAAMPPA